MAKVKEDLISGNSVFKNAEGFRVIRTIKVYELESTDSLIYQEAINAVENLAIGQSHPKYSDSILRSIEPRAEGNGVVNLTCEYIAYDPNYMIYVFNGVPKEETVTSDLDGSTLTVGYRYNSQDDAPIPNMTTQTTDNKYLFENSAEASIYTPHMSVSVSRKEMTTHSDLVLKIIQSQAFVNDGPFFLDNTATPRLWLLTDISSRNIIPETSGNYGIYEVTYTFEYNFYTWDYYAFYIEPKTGRPPEDLGEGWQPESVINRKMYTEVNFNSILGI
jgi:hypothetical protein